MKKSTKLNSIQSLKVVVWQDFHSLDGRTVKEDPSQDLELVYGEQIEDTTVLRYS